MTTATRTVTPHVLALANATTDSGELLDAVREATRNRPDARVLVVAPALNGRIRHWASDDAEAVEAARERLRVSVQLLARDGVEATGMIGDPDPAQALADALAVFPADSLVIVTQPEARSNWLAKGLVERVRRSCELEIVHLTRSSNDPAEHSLAA
jgi:hypothetical protein